MDVLLVGGTGFIGTALCSELVDRGHAVTALSRTPDDTTLPDAVTTVAGDGTDTRTVSKTLAGHDAVVNLVALSPLFEPKGNRTHQTVHVGATQATIEAAETHDVDRLVQLSALGADPHGQTAYIRAKGDAETLVKETTVPWTIFRPSVIFGDGGEFVPFVKRLTPGPVKALPGGGRTKFQPLWVGDLVGMIAQALVDDDHAGETYEVGGPEVLSLADITKLVYRADGRSVSIVSVPMELTRIGLSLAEPVPFIPMGLDQARSLEMDNVIEDNDVTAFGIDPETLRTLGEYLGVHSVEVVSG